jgi:fimbrial chaperone protein
LSSNRFLRLAFCTWILGLCAAASAADFSVSPIKLFFDRQTRAAIVTLNNDAEEPLVVQMSLNRWTQDADAKDVYTESEDYQFFPRLMTVPSKDRRVIRIGIKAPLPGNDEVLYRLFITEVLQSKEKSSTPAVQMAFRFALPIFVAPDRPSAKAEIGPVLFEKAALSSASSTAVKFTIRNTGTENFRIESIRLAPPNGESIKEAEGWYLLPAITREHTINIEPLDCNKIKQLEITIKADKLTLSKLVAVPPAACRN